MGGCLSSLDDCSGEFLHCWLVRLIMECWSKVNEVGKKFKIPSTVFGYSGIENANLLPQEGERESKCSRRLK